MMPAIPPHNTAVVDKPWDGPGNEAKLSNNAGASTLRLMYAWVDPSKDHDTKAAYKFPHHEVTGGRPGAANVNGVRNALSRLGQSNVPESDQEGVRRHLQTHLDAYNNSQQQTSAETTGATGMRALIGEEIDVAETGEGLGTLVGYLARFNEWTEIDSALEGHFLEKIAPSAFRKTFREGVGRIRCIFHHGLDPSVGLRVLGPAQVLEEREDGAYCEVPLLDTSYNRDLAPGIKAGLYGMSFRFRAVRQNYDKFPKKSEHNPQGLPERTLLELAVPEFGPTPFAAYAGAHAGMRCITDEMTLEQLASEPGRLAELVNRTQVAFPATLRSTEEAHESHEETTEAEPGASGPPVVRAVTERLYERSVFTATNVPWQMTPEALALVLSILRERADGYRPSPEEIRDRLGVRSEADAPVTGPVAVIPISGPIIPKGDAMSNMSGMTSVDSLQRQFRQALNDSTVQSILFDVDSPGGSSSMIEEFAQEIMDARGTKPIVASANTLMASAALHLMVAADEVYASPSAMVGSIGVYAAHQDLTAAQEKLGRRVTLITSKDSPHKTEFSPFVELSAGAEAEMQRRVDSVMDGFLEAVATGRGTTVEDVKENYGQGRVLSAREAKAVGMVDGVETFDQTLSRLVNAATTPDESADRAVAQPKGHAVRSRRGIDPVTLREREDPPWSLQKG